MYNSEIKSSTPWTMLLSRTFLFAFFQLIIAGIIAISGSPSPWGDSAGWWPLSALCANMVSIFLLKELFHKEKLKFFNFINFSRKTMWQDIGITILLFVVIAPLAIFPNQWLAKGLLGSEEAAFAMFFRQIPLWAKIVSIGFPLSIAFAELPTYFGYVMPRLEKQLKSSWWAWAFASFFLAFQHVALPLIFDWHFMLWRLGMFIPLAFFMGLCIKLRPRLFLYFMIGHALLDLSTVMILFTLK